MDDRNACQQAHSAVTEDEARAALDRLLADRKFHATDRHRKLLRYLIDEFFAGRSGRVKAYTIAIDVFGRPTTFDAATDPIVRVEVSRLRAALAQYHDNFGEKAGLRIELPKGNYVPHFTTSGRSPAPSGIAISPVERRRKPDEPEAIPAIVQPKRRRFTLIAGAVAGAAVMGGAAYLSFVERFPWQPVLSAKPTIVIIVPTASGADAEEQRKASDYLVHALSHFSGVRTLTQRPAAGVDGSSQSGKEYHVSIAYNVASHEHRVSWQVVDAQSNEALRAGTAKADIDSSDARAVQEKLLTRLAGSLAGEEGVIVSLEAAGQLVSPSLGYGCVLLAYASLARIDPEGLASARTCLERSVTYQAVDADVLASLAMVLVATGEASASPTAAARAMELADKAVALAPQSSQSYVAQMQARFVGGDKEAAFLSGRRAAALNPLDDAIPARLGLLFFVSGDYSEGVRLARVAEAGCDYLHRDAALTLALDDYRNGKYRDALTRARQLANPADTAVNILRMASAGQLSLTREATNALGGLRWTKRGLPQSAETELAARGYAPDLIALIDEGLSKAGVRLASLP
ncbi:hypothetical protein IB277_29905 [Ensifer sp. ENS07]|uniref:tetratricopeptide repeat protein n=1 Tax=Ensifer sp. ENS07 TaxID=2769274 RepID=UPI00178457D6|nr:hypothetical protein [Ensifer sp. ENS07]MBD9640515.1 hypothetical protein [Ensifer sp. ENS07]